MDYSKNFLVVGTGISGSGVIKFLLKKGAAFDVYGKSKVLKKYDYAVVSAGIPLETRIVKALVRKKIEITGELSLAQSELKGTTVGITGTNGKTTTTFLIEHLLKNANINAKALGNCGESIVMHESFEDGFNVIEISSYMLEKSLSFSPEIAVLLNLAPDHVFHHGSIEKYYACKMQMFLNQSSKNHAIINADCDESMARAKNFPAQKMFFSVCGKVDGAYVSGGAFYFKNEMLCSVKDISLIGEHNLSNVCAAICVAKIANVSNEKIIEGLKNFAEVKHRLNFVCAKNGKIFINDSKATNIASTLCALKAVKGKKVLILGGLGKGENFGKLFINEKFNTQKVVCYGKDGKKILRQIKTYFNESEMFFEKDFKQAVNLASNLTSEGEICLLSPGCASFDQHKNFEQRGDEFKRIVSND